MSTAFSNWNVRRTNVFRVEPFQVLSSLYDGTTPNGTPPSLTSCVRSQQLLLNLRDLLPSVSPFPPFNNHYTYSDHLRVTLQSTLICVNIHAHQITQALGKRW